MYRNRCQLFGQHPSKPIFCDVASQFHDPCRSGRLVFKPRTVRGSPCSRGLNSQTDELAIQAGKECVLGLGRRVKCGANARNFFRIFQCYGNGILNLFSRQSFCLRFIEAASVSVGSFSRFFLRFLLGSQRDFVFIRGFFLGSTSGSQSSVVVTVAFLRCVFCPCPTSCFISSLLRHSEVDQILGKVG